MSRRPTLGTMLEQIQPPTAPEEAATPEAAVTFEEAVTPGAAGAPDLVATESAVVPVSESASSGRRPVAETDKGRPAQALSPRSIQEGGGQGEGPRYLTMVRKEARITESQSEDLAIITRRLNRARAGRGERITDNTLIRVAIDLLLERRESLVGTTEDELRNSVSL